LALAPLFATADGGPRPRDTARMALLFAVVLAVVLAATVLPFLPDGGLREIYDRTVGYQASRRSPFSVWGQLDSGETWRAVASASAVGLALLVALVPRRKQPLQVAALAAAVLIAVQLAASHWFYLYVVWFAPLALVALMAAYRVPGDDAPSEPRWVQVVSPAAPAPAAAGST
jgi:uncharacterized BrkB/YihY/UPF0761 family membrane protein